MCAHNKSGVKNKTNHTFPQQSLSHQRGEPEKRRNSTSSSPRLMMAAAHAAVTGSHLRRNQGSKLTAKPLPVAQEVSSALLLVVEEEEEGLATAL